MTSTRAPTGRTLPGPARGGPALLSGSMAKDTQAGGRVTPKSTGRYTPPVPKQVKVSPRWVPVLMGALLLVGAAVILLNYVNVLPGSVTNWYLLLGLGLITAGFITATQWR